MKIEKFEDHSVKDSVEVDYYVPITIEFPENDDKTGALYYYRFINQQSSFVEVKINSVTKKIIGITLTSVNDIKDANIEFDNYIEKNPIVDLNIFSKEEVVTTNAHFEMIKTKDSIYFILDKEKVESVVKMSEHLYVFFDLNNRIIGIKFTGFSKEDWKEIEESIQGSVIN